MLFQDSWGRIQPDSWVRNVISYGYLIEFTSPPPVGGLLRVTPVPANLDKRLALEKEIQDLLSKGAIHRVSPEIAHELYRSSFFLTPKKPNTWRPILNLKPLNKAFIKPKRFRMETLASIIPSLSRGMWATSVDLKDAYLHVPIHASHQRFLAFRYRGRDYAFNAMPFGLSTAPRVFTRITRTVLAFLRKHGVLVFAYLDDWLILAHSEQQAVETTQFVVETLQALGWIINTEKSSLTPSQRVTYLGAILDFSLGQAFPTPERIQALVEMAALILSKRVHQARTWLRLLGLMASLVEVLPFCRLYMRPVQFHTLSHFKPDTDLLTTPIPVTEEVVPFVRWWTHRENVLQGRPFRLHRPQTSITTDASLTGWGATWGPKSLAGQWSDSEKLLHINVLELRAIRNAVSGWISDLKGFDVTILSDNSTAVAYVNHQGGTKSLRLCRDTWDLLLLCQRSDINLRATHLAGRLNLQADALSRGLRNENEWELSQPWANLVFDLFGRPFVDLFATHRNAKLPTFCSRFHHPLAWKVDALSFGWTGLSSYAFPPWSMVHTTLLKLSQSPGEMLLIAPFWPNQAWFPLILELLVDLPFAFPTDSHILIQDNGRVRHQRLADIKLTAWKLSPNACRRKEFLRELLALQPELEGNPPLKLTTPDWRSFHHGRTLTLAIPWKQR